MLLSRKARSPLHLHESAPHTHGEAESLQPALPPAAQTLAISSGSYAATRVRGKIEQSRCAMLTQETTERNPVRLGGPLSHAKQLDSECLV